MLIRLPLDGNPNSSMGLIAHAGTVAGACISFDGSMVLTTGGADYGIMSWQVDTGALDAAVVMGGSGDAPFEALIPGGKQGEFYDEMCNYFYLAQLRAQGEDSTEERGITGRCVCVCVCVCVFVKHIHTYIHMYMQGSRGHGS
jgi:hypothetical protein